MNEHGFAANGWPVCLLVSLVLLGSFSPFGKVAFGEFFVGELQVLLPVIFGDVVFAAPQVVSHYAFLVALHRRIDGGPWLWSYRRSR